MPAALPIPKNVREDWNEPFSIDDAHRNQIYSFCHRSLGPKDKTKIPCGHTWEASLTLRIQGFGRCPICNTWRRRVTDVLRSEWREGFDIFDATSNNIYKWQCGRCDYLFSSTLISRILGTDCPKCARRKAGISMRKMAIPQYVRDDWDEQAPIDEAKQRDKYRFIHRSPDLRGKTPCGLPWTARLWARLALKTGCPHCNSRKQPTGKST